MLRLDRMFFKEFPHKIRGVDIPADITRFHVIVLHLGVYWSLWSLSRRRFLYAFYNKIHHALRRHPGCSCEPRNILSRRNFGGPVVRVVDISIAEVSDQPRQRGPAAGLRPSFLVYDTIEKKVAFYRIDYDIAACRDKIIRAGLPPQPATRLEMGW